MKKVHFNFACSLDTKKSYLNCVTDQFLVASRSLIFLHLSFHFGARCMLQDKHMELLNFKQSHFVYGHIRFLTLAVRLAPKNVYICFDTNIFRCFPPVTTVIDGNRSRSRQIQRRANFLPPSWAEKALPDCDGYFCLCTPKSQAPPC